ncbi:hypothetical protein SGRA_2752 [Saprospira grandis str. Lewin]|uniref:Uncharacterized protein n=1 Tax=Saprospira grandis (strain Lewin) TaxID=984262 RepID=H6L9K4_SAPGL|nr:hypothetical protein SGRA_2752 [Saprospira grandis str. Lewin]
MALLFGFFFGPLFLFFKAKKAFYPFFKPKPLVFVIILTKNWKSIYFLRIK